MRTRWTSVLVAGALAMFGEWAGGAERVVRVLETSDLHGAMVASPPAEQGRVPSAGFARLATVIKEAREGNPATVLLDGGDFAQGTLESFLSRGMRMVDALNILGYDAVGLGNHEFDWGVDSANTMLERLQMPVLAANFSCEDYSGEGLRKVKPYIVKEVGGLKVAIVGLTTPNLPHWFRDFSANGLRTAGSVETLERLLPELRRLGPDIMVLLVHQGLLTEDNAANELNAIGARFPEFDVMLGGHLHWALPGAKVGRVDYGQPGAYASGVLQVDLTWDDEAREVVKKEFRVLSAGEGTMPDSQLLMLFREDVERAKEAYGEVLATAERAMGPSQVAPGLSPLQQVLAKALMAGTGAEAVFCGTSGSERLLAGPITVRDLWRICPYENDVGVAWLTKDEIRQVAEEMMALWGTERYVPLAGLQYDIYPNAEPGERIRNVRSAEGKALNGRRRIPVAFNSYLLSGAGGRMPELANLLHFPQTRLERNGLLVRDLVAAWLRANDPVSVGAGTEARVFRRERRLWERKADFENSLE